MREPTEFLVSVDFPVWKEPGLSVGAGFEEVSPRHGDFAIVDAAVQIAVDADGVCKKIAAAVGGAGPCPIRLSVFEAAVVGENLSNGVPDDAVALISDALEPSDDLHATAAYRRRVAPVLVGRALTSAVEEAGRA